MLWRYLIKFSLQTFGKYLWILITTKRQRSTSNRITNFGWKNKFNDPTKTPKRILSK